MHGAGWRLLHYRWIPEWGDFAMASDAEDIQFSSLLGEVATFDGVRGICFWTMGSPLKCRTRIELPFDLDGFSACYAGHWYVYCTGSVGSTRMICRQYSSDGHAAIFAMPSVDRFDLRAGMYSPPTSVYGPQHDLLAIVYRERYSSLILMYRQNELLQWVLECQFSPKGVAFDPFIIKPHACMVGYRKHKLVYYAVTPHGLQIACSPIDVMGYDRMHWFNDLWQEYPEYSVSWSSFLVRTKFRNNPWKLPWSSWYYRPITFSLHCPWKKQRLVLNITDARQSWMSACA
jgi:hypothetical protein